jgi:uncharacterized BrkB/YihY/UPF0761 family membrane protein
MHRHFISIWFFIGILLGIYGTLILGAGIYDLVHPPEQTVKMAYLHAGIWWGALLLILGLVYTYKFAPKRPPSEGPAAQR